MKKKNLKLDLPVLIIPSLLVIAFCICFFIYPDASNRIFADVINPIFRDKFGLLYLFVNLFGFILAFYFSFSKYGDIVLGDKNDKPAYSFFTWGAMMFCCGLGGDIIFYSFTEWLNYVQEPYIQSLGNPYYYSNAYSMFFWANYWLYLVIGVCFAFMMFVRKNNKQKFSESMRPILNKNTDGLLGNIVDIFSVFVIICAVTCSIGMTMPMISTCLNKLIGVPSNKWTTIILIIVCAMMYCCSVYNGLKGVGFLSKICVYLFLIMLGYIFISGNQIQYILESSFKQLGILISNLPFMFTDIDPLRESTFVQDYCVFYDAFWLTWVICVPFFIAIISRGMKIKQVILGGLLFAVPGGLLSYVIIPNYGMAQQLLKNVDIIGIYNSTGDLYGAMASIIETLPFPKIAFLLILVTMLCFCASTYDSVSMSCAFYSYKNIDPNDMPSRNIRLYWALGLTLFPLALTFADASYENLQNVAVLAGFPAAIIFILIVISFMKDANKFLSENKKK